MAERRMFAKTIIDSDAFLDMPLSTQSLYFHLSMRADDEGFINNPKKIQRMIGATEDDLKLLIAKNFIIPFDSGIVVIKHWRIHNYIRADRLVETKYREERELLNVKDNGAYTISDDVKEIEALDSSDIRKIAYKKSSLPYSFNYKIKRAFEGQNCPICNREMTSAYKNCLPTVQHNIPISKGGIHELENISVICESCNTSIKDTETDHLNNRDVINIWDKIVLFEANKIKWFDNPSLLWQTTDGQVTDNGQSMDSIGKVRLGKDSIEKVKKGNNNIYSREENIPFSEIIDYLNRVCGTSYRASTKKTQDCIKARWNEGFRVDDFKKVIDNKAAEWLNDSKFCKYLRPETLFSNKFEGYLNQGNIKPVTRGGIEIDNGFRQGLDAEIVHFNVGG